MTDNSPSSPEQGKSIARRKPQQARALYKIELILEATMRLLENGEIYSITTNSIAEVAGVSIGTIYQYFDGKQAILDALSEREIEQLWNRLLIAVQSPWHLEAGDRIRGIFKAFANIFGGAQYVHRGLPRVKQAIRPMILSIGGCP